MAKRRNVRVRPPEVPEVLAFERFDQYSNGLCECCKKQLRRSNRGRRGRQAWEAHHRFRDRENVTIDNIRVVCTTGRKCHLKCCHNGAYQNYPTPWSPCNRSL